MNDLISRTPRLALLGLLVLLSALLVSQTAFAQGNCINDLTGEDNLCASDYVSLSLLNNTARTCTPGDNVELTLAARLLASGEDRFDIGILLALDGGQADWGLCYHDFLPPPVSWGGYCSDQPATACLRDDQCASNDCVGGYNPDGGNPYYDAESATGFPDTCGDLEVEIETIRYLAPITVPCIDADGDGLLDIGAALSGDYAMDSACLVLDDTVPTDGTWCRFATVDVENVTVAAIGIQVGKQADPTELPEAGGMVTYTYTVENTGDVTVTLHTLTDTVYGWLWQWEDGDCQVPQTLGPGGIYSCTIHAEVTGTLGIHENTVTATATDPNQTVITGTARAEVLLVSMDPVIAVTKTAAPPTIQEPGGEIQYTVTIANNSDPNDPVTLTILQDSLYGDLTDPANPLIAGGTCATGTILPLESYSCGFRALVSGVSGNVITDIVTATVIDNERVEAQASDDATVTIVPHIPDTGMGLPGTVVAGGAMAVGLALLFAGVLARRRKA